MKKNIKLKKILIIYSKKSKTDIKCVEYLNKFKIKLTKIFSTGIRKENLKSKINKWNGDYIIHLSSYYKLTNRDLKKAKIALNFHPSPPKYPGSGGYSKALFNLDKKFGVTVHYMNNKIDNGKIVGFYSFKINKNLTLEKLIKKTSNFRLLVFKKIVRLLLTNDGENKILKLSNNNKFQWSKKRGQIKDIDRIQKVGRFISKSKLERIIRSTRIGKYNPYILLHGYKFELKINS